MSVAATLQHTELTHEVDFQLLVACHSMALMWHTEIELTLVVDFQPGSPQHTVKLWHTEIELTHAMHFQPGSRKHTAH